jgi:hypothetical protein
MKTTTKTLFFWIIYITTQGPDKIYATETTIEPVTDITATRFQSTSEIVKNMAIPRTYFSLITQLYTLGKDTRPLLFPNEDEKANTKEINRKINLFDANKEFRCCLMKNKNNTQRDKSGLPIACERAAYEFEMIGGSEEFERILGTFNKYKKQRDIHSQNDINR